MSEILMRSLRFLVASALCTSTAAAQAQWLAEHPVNAHPRDVAVSPDGLWAIVRGKDNAPTGPEPVSGYELWPASKFSGFTGCSSTFGQGSGTSLSSDLCQMTNSRAILIGSKDTDANSVEDTTYVDIVTWDYTADPPVGTCLANHPLFAASPTPTTIAGDANDVAVTPNQNIAVVNHQNWIHVFKLRDGSILGAFNVGSNPVPGGARPTNPSGVVDSVGVTNTRAVVITNRTHPGQSLYTELWAYIVDLSVTPPVIRMEQRLAAGDNQPHAAHDVAITPDGNWAVVTGNGVVSLLDMVNYQVTAEVVDNFLERLYRVFVGGEFLYMRDSVEVATIAGAPSTTCAVVISNRFVLPNSRKWHADVYDITAGQLTPLGSPAGFEDPNYPQNHVHDLAVTPDGTKAVIKSALQDVVIRNIPAPLVSTFISQGDPQNAGGLTFVADSVVATDTIAVTIGTDSVFPGFSKRAYIDFISLSTPTMTPVIVGGQGFHTIPGDLTLTRDSLKVVVRLTELPDDPGSPTGNDLLLYNMVYPPTLYAQFGASGSVYGLDSIEVGDDRAISISQSSGSSGWVQIIDL